MLDRFAAGKDTFYRPTQAKTPKLPPAALALQREAARLQQAHRFTDAAALQQEVQKAKALAAARLAAARAADYKAEVRMQIPVQLLQSLAGFVPWRAVGRY